MEISAVQTDVVSLAALAADAARMLRARQFNTLAAAYGYAMAYGRELSQAIVEDLRACLTELGAAALAQSDLPPVAEVKYFKPGEHALFAVVECVLPTTASGSVMLELVVTVSDAQKHVCLEQLSTVT